MTLTQLESALASKDANRRAKAVATFGRTAFGAEALPVLRRALADAYVSTVIAAAECIAKLGPAAMESADAEEELPTGVNDERADLESQLILAGSRVWAYSGHANCYAACLDALIRIEADPDFVIEFVHDHIGLTAPHDLLASLQALATIGTPDALDLFDRSVTFWRPEMNKGTSKKVEALIAKSRKSKAKAR